MLEQSQHPESDNAAQATAVLAPPQEPSQRRPTTQNHRPPAGQRVQPPSPPAPAASGDNASNWSESLQTTLDHPPAALPRYMVLVGFLFACMFGTWAWFGTMQDVSHAQGELVPEGDTYKVQPVTAGEVSNILVQEGDTIQAGQLIMELDTDLLQSDVERLSQNLTALTSQLQQTQVLIDQTQQEADAQRAIANAEIQTQEAAIFESEANIRTHQNLVNQLTADVNANESRLQRLKSLFDEGAISAEYLFDVEQTLRDRRRVMTERRGQVQQSLSQTDQLNAQLDLRLAEATRSELENREKLKRLQLEANNLDADIVETQTLLKAAQTNLEQMFLHAPVSGTVSAVNISNVGEVAQPGQTMIEIAPAETPLVLSAMLPIKEAGLVKKGMGVQIKFDAFPYQQYGIVSGQVMSISPDSKLDEHMGAVYSVEVALEQDHVIHETEVVALKAGQTAKAEIVIRKRRIIDFLLDPIRQLKESSLTV